MQRAVTLVVSGVPTVVGWTVMSRLLDNSEFAAVSLAVSLPLVMNFVLPALGANVANAFPHGPEAIAGAIASGLKTNARVTFALLVTACGIAVGPGFARLLALDVSATFPLDVAVLVVVVLIGAWFVVMVGEWTLIAADRASVRVWCVALNGPLMLTGVEALRIVGAPAWTYVVPVPLSMLMASTVALFFALRIAEVRPQLIRNALRRPLHVRLAGVTGALIALEGALAVSFWLVRPVTSIRGTDAEVAATVLCIQYAYPALSLVGVLSQVLWPTYVRRRGHLNRMALGRDTGLFAAFGLVLGAGFAAAVVVAVRIGVVGTPISLGLAVVTGALILAQAVLQPAKVAFASPGTAARLGLLAALVLGTTDLVTVLASPSPVFTIAVLAGGISVLAGLAIWLLTPQLAFLSPVVPDESVVHEE